mmetsp:Transcript_46538/g.115872  ORF Transcript_46538/g.115872 Transcript_46538/m.115872 type:complete len:220 (+) Transcript_46538:124-783(+)
MAGSPVFFSISAATSKPSSSSHGKGNVCSGSIRHISRSFLSLSALRGLVSCIRCHSSCVSLGQRARSSALGRHVIPSLSNVFRHIHLTAERYSSSYVVTLGSRMNSRSIFSSSFFASRAATSRWKRDDRRNLDVLPALLVSSSGFLVGPSCCCSSSSRSAATRGSNGSGQSLMGGTHWPDECTVPCSGLYSSAGVSTSHHSVPSGFTCLTRRLCGMCVR